jgi:hypothetical protein
MKRLIIFIGLILFSLNSEAKDSTATHFELNASALFWEPISTHLVGDYDSHSKLYSKFNGFGNTIAPTINLNYFFTNGIGLTLGYNYLFLEKTEAQQTNSAIMHNLRIGLGGRLFKESLISLSFFTGINMLTSYHFDMPTIFTAYGDSKLSANGSAIGAFFSTEANISIYKGIFIHTTLDFTYIPTTLKYNADYPSFQIYQSEITNLGGIGLQLGFGYRF